MYTYRTKMVTSVSCLDLDTAINEVVAGDERIVSASFEAGVNGYLATLLIERKVS